jgi:hypothetical protein
MTSSILNRAREVFRTGALKAYSPVPKERLLGHHLSTLLPLDSYTQRSEWCCSIPDRLSNMLSSCKLNSEHVPRGPFTVGSQLALWTDRLTLWSLVWSFNADRVQSYSAWHDELCETLRPRSSIGPR